MCYFQYSHTVFAYLGFQLKWFQLLKDQYGSKLQSCGCHWKKHMVKPMVKPKNLVKSHDCHIQMPCYLPKVLIFPTNKSPQKRERHCALQVQRSRARESCSICCEVTMGTGGTKVKFWRYLKSIVVWCYLIFDIRVYWLHILYIIVYIYIQFFYILFILYIIYIIYIYKRMGLFRTWQNLTIWVVLSRFCPVQHCFFKHRERNPRSCEFSSGESARCQADWQNVAGMFGIGNIFIIIYYYWHNI